MGPFSFLKSPASASSSLMERNLREDQEHCHLVAILRNCRCLQEEGGHSESEVQLLAILWQGLAHSAQHLTVLVQECLP